MWFLGVAAHLRRRQRSLSHLDGCNMLAAAVKLLTMDQPPPKQQGHLSSQSLTKN
jgi:hypothetical protein